MTRSHTSRKLIPLATLVTVATAWLLAPPPAHACKCDPAPALSLPRDGATAVPTNTRVVVSHRTLLDKGLSAETALALLRADAGTTGETVPAAESTRPFHLRSYRMLTPEKPLTPGKRHVLVARPPDGAAPVVLTAFTTGKGADTTPPAFDGITNFSAKATIGKTDDAPSKTCTVRTDGAWSTARFGAEYAAATDDTTGHDDLLFRIHVYPKTKGAKRSEETVRHIWPGSEPVPEKPEDHLCNPFPPRLIAGDKVCAAVEAVDLAGNIAGTARVICGPVRLKK